MPRRGCVFLFRLRGDARASQDAIVSVLFPLLFHVLSTPPGGPGEGPSSLEFYASDRMCSTRLIDAEGPLLTPHGACCARGAGRGAGSRLLLLQRSECPGHRGPAGRPRPRGPRAPGVPARACAPGFFPSFLGREQHRRRPEAPRHQAAPHPAQGGGFLVLQVVHSCVAPATCDGNPSPRVLNPKP